MLKIADIRIMTVEEIAEKVEALKKEHYSLRVQAQTGKLEKQNRISEIKRDIARLLTVKNEMARSGSK